MSLSICVLRQRDRTKIAQIESKSFDAWGTFVYEPDGVTGAAAYTLLAVFGGSLNRVQQTF